MTGKEVHRLPVLTGRSPHPVESANWWTLFVLFVLTLRLLSRRLPPVRRKVGKPTPSQEEAEEFKYEEEVSDTYLLDFFDLTVHELQLIRNAHHVLVDYMMKPKDGRDYLFTAARIAAEFCFCADVPACTMSALTADASFVYHVDPEAERMKIAYPTWLFDSNIIDGHALMCSVMSFKNPDNESLPDVEYGRIDNIYFPPSYLRLFDDTAMNISDLWPNLNHGITEVGSDASSIRNPEPSQQRSLSSYACCGFWLVGDFISAAGLLGSHQEYHREVVSAMLAAIKGTRASRLFSTNISADDPCEMRARRQYILSEFNSLVKDCALLVDSYSLAESPDPHGFHPHFLHFHQASLCPVTRPHTPRPHSAFLRIKMASVVGSNCPYTLAEQDVIEVTTPIILNGTNALSLPAFFENLGHSNVILTAGSGAYTHKDGAKAGFVSCQQAEQVWRRWRGGWYGNMPLFEAVLKYAATHEEIKGAFVTFQGDADKLYPGWKEKLGFGGSAEDGTLELETAGANVQVGEALVLGALEAMREELARVEQRLAAAKLQVEEGAQREEALRAEMLRKTEAYEKEMMTAREELISLGLVAERAERRVQEAEGFTRYTYQAASAANYHAAWAMATARAALPADHFYYQELQPAAAVQEEEDEEEGEGEDDEEEEEEEFETDRTTAGGDPVSEIED